MKPKKILFFIIIFVIIFGGCTESAKEADTNETNATYQVESQQEQTVSPSLYDEGSYIGLNYRDATFGDIEMDKPVVFRGKISQTIDDSELVMQTKYKCYIPGTFSCEQGDYEEQGVLLLFPIRPKILENDIVSVFGRYSGVTKQDLVSGQEISVPEFKIDYYRIGNGLLYDAHSGQYVNGDFVKIDTGEVNDIGMAKYKVVFKTYAEMKQIKAQEVQEQAEADAKVEKEQAEADAIANAEAKKKNFYSLNSSDNINIWHMYIFEFCKGSHDLDAYIYSNLAFKYRT